MNINLDKGSGRGTTGEDRASSGPRARRADRRPEDPEDDRRDDGGRRDGQNPRDEDFPEHGPLDVLAAERRQRDGRHGADLLRDRERRERREGERGAPVFLTIRSMACSGTRPAKTTTRTMSMHQFRWRMHEMHCSNTRAIVAERMQLKASASVSHEGSCARLQSMRFTMSTCQKLELSVLLNPRAETRKG